MRDGRGPGVRDEPGLGAGEERLAGGKADAPGDRAALPGTADPFPPEVIAQIARHMNDDHADDNVLIVRALGGAPAATAARMSGMDADGMEFAAAVDGVEVPVRVPFSTRLTERRQVRAEAVRMYRQACTALGLEPRH
jgi:putative heme iron utilization protein